MHRTTGAPDSVLHHPPQAGSHGCRRWVFRRKLLQLIGAVHHTVQPPSQQIQRQASSIDADPIMAAPPPPPPVRSPLTSTTSIASSIRARRRVSAVTPITAHPSRHRTADPEASTVPCVRRLFLPKTHLPHFRLAPSDPSIAHQSSGEQQHPRSSMAFDVISFRHHPASVWS
ncbi:hypothetical protein ACLOJK_020011 [Asimina triloba]